MSFCRLTYIEADKKTKEKKYIERQTTIHTEIFTPMGNLESRDLIYFTQNYL